MNKITTWWRARQLGSSDPNARIAALAHLGEQKHVESAPAIAEMLQDEERAVRMAAAQALGLIGAPDSAGPLIKMLVKERYWDVRYEAVEALRKIGDPQTVNQLVLLLEEKKCDSSLQQIISWALKEFGWEELTDEQRAALAIRREEWDLLLSQGESAIEPLVEAVRSGTHRIRRRAAATLAQLDSPTALERLLEMLDDPALDIRQAAAWALDGNAWGKLPPERAAQTALILEKWPSLVGLGEAACPMLGEILDDPDRQKRLKALNCLGRIGGSAVVPQLIRAAGDHDIGVQQAAVQALSDVANLENADVLANALRDDNPKLRGAISQILKRIGWKPQSTTERAAFLIACDDWDELAALGADAVPALSEAVRTATTRTRALEVLGRIGKPALPVLMDLMGDPAAAVRCSVIDALGDAGDATISASLIEALDHDEDIAVRKSAFAALRKLNWQPRDITHQAHIAMRLDEWHRIPEMGQGVIPVLLQAIDDEAVASRAHYALEQMLAGDGAASIDEAYLRSLTSLVTAPTRAGGIQGRGPDGGRTLQNAVARRRIGQLARAEIQRREQAGAVAASGGKPTV